MGLYAVAVEGKYTTKRKSSSVCILLEAKSDKDAIRQAQTLFLDKFPDDYVQDFNCIQITLDATKSNPSQRNPMGVKVDATSSN